MTWLRRSLAVIALGAAAFALGAWLTSGFAFSIAGVTLSSREPIRPAVLAIAAAALYLLTTGWTAAAQEFRVLATQVRPAGLALALACGVVGVAVTWNAWTAGGADAYAYTTQSDLWLDHRLTIPVPIAKAAPWPRALDTFTPYGYRAVPDRHVIVPVTAPGLPLMMASLKAIAGHCAAFWVVPLTGGLLVWLTFALGRRAGSDRIGLAAAWLLATSPTVLAMTKSIMSDVPAAAFWTLAAWCLLGGTARKAGAAGLSASAAILVRPNLVPLAAAMAVWSAWSDGAVLRRWERPLLFTVGVVPGCLGIAWLNAQLYGSPFSSGYGDLHGLFSIGNAAANLQRYGSWLIETQTPVALAGIAALVPVRWLWPTGAARRTAVLLAVIVLVVWGCYLVYAPFDAWWFLRFLLPTFPAMCIGSAVVVLRLFDRGGARGRAAAAASLLLVGLFCARLAVKLGVFPPNEGERRYATVAELVRAVTDRSAAIITGQHVGSIRYYAGRLTIQFEQLDHEWLDAAVDWLIEQKRHPYFLLEDWERPLFERRFAARNARGRLDLVPVLAYDAYSIGGTIYLYDLLRPHGPTSRPPSIPDPHPRCLPPAPPPSLSLGPAPPSRTERAPDAAGDPISPVARAQPDDHGLPRSACW